MRILFLQSFQRANVAKHTMFCVFPHFRTFANIMMVYPISLGTTAFFMVVAVLLCHPARTYRATQAKATAR